MGDNRSKVKENILKVLKLWVSKIGDMHHKGSLFMNN